MQKNGLMTKDSFTPIKIHSTLVLFVFVATACIYHQLFNLGFSHDDLVFFTAKNVPNILNTDFLRHIFFQPNSYSTHYRPLGFFGYFFIMGKVAEGLPIAFDIVGIIILLYSAHLFYQITRETVKDQFLALVITLCYCSHFSFLRIFLNYSDHLKYGITLIIFLYLMLLAVKSTPLSTGRIAYLTSLQGLAIGCHEASFIFSLIFLGLHFLYSRHFKKVSLIICLPSALYLFSRVYFWGIPNQGYFGVHWSMSPLFILQQVGLFWSPTLGNYSRGEFNFALLVSIILFTLTGIVLAYLLSNTQTNKSKTLIIFFIFAALLLQVPFSPLVNHWDFAKLKAMVWASPMLILALVHATTAVNISTRKIIFFLMLPLFYYGSFESLSAQVMRKTTEINLHQNIFKTRIKEKIKECDSCVIRLQNIDSLVDAQRCESYFIRTYTVPAILAVYYPQHTFIIDYTNSRFTEAIIKGGYIYYLTKSGTLIDIFGFAYKPLDLDNKKSINYDAKKSTNPNIWTCTGNS